MSKITAGANVASIHGDGGETLAILNKQQMNTANRLTGIKSNQDFLKPPAYSKQNQYNLFSTI